MVSLFVFAIVSVFAFYLLRGFLNFVEGENLQPLTTFLSDSTSGNEKTTTSTAHTPSITPGTLLAGAFAFVMVVIAFLAGLSNDNPNRSSISSASTPPNLIQNLVSNKLQKALDRAITADSRNDGIEASAYYRNTFSDSEAVFNLTGFTGDKSRMDVFRLFLDFADTLQDERFEGVILAHDSVEKFKIDGDYFQKLGRERHWQNPTYTVRTFPENLRTIDGSRAYGEWTGGVIGVLREQMEDFNDFHDKWYLDDNRGSSTSLVSSPRTWTTPTAVVTKSQYDRLRDGMSYSQVGTTIGTPGEEVSRNVIDGVPGVMDRLETVMYSWSNDDGSNMNAMFQNNRMIQKAQFGLR